jgi:hypothetical protein
LKKLLTKRKEIIKNNPDFDYLKDLMINVDDLDKKVKKNIKKKKREPKKRKKNINKQVWQIESQNDKFQGLETFDLTQEPLKKPNPGIPVFDSSFDLEIVSKEESLKKLNEDNNY